MKHSIFHKILRRFSAFTLCAAILFSALGTLTACSDQSGKEYACFTLFEEITADVDFPLYGRLTVDLRNVPLNDEETNRLWVLFEDFAEKNDIHVFRYSLTESKEEGYLTEESDGTYSFLNGYHFCFGYGEEQEDGSLLFDVSYIWESTYNAFGAANAVVTPKGSGWELESYDSWNGMANP